MLLDNRIIITYLTQSEDLDKILKFPLRSFIKENCESQDVMRLIEKKEKGFGFPRN